MTTGTLKVYAQGERELVITREFDAPRHLVFEAFTRPEHLRRWLSGMPGWELAVCDMDVRVGGTYRWVWKSLEGGHSMGMGGEYREVSPPDRLVSTEKFDESWYPGTAVGTIVLTEHGGRTTLTQTMLYESREARDAVLASPMEEGVGLSYDRLEDVLRGLAG
jgi:uncharacterized protein YndB with AHSA1/START domain